MLHCIIFAKKKSLVISHYNFGEGIQGFSEKKYSRVLSLIRFISNKIVTIKLLLLLIYYYYYKFD